jgi:hypothetical protein
MNRLLAAGILMSYAVIAAGEGSPNTWTKVSIDWNAVAAAHVSDGRFVTTDGFSDNLLRAKSGEVLIRTGIESKQLGTSPGFYTNTTVAWNVKAGTARVVEIANWGGGSYGGGKLLPAFKDHPTPTPRHTYDSIAHVPAEDAMYMILGANWRIGSNGDEAAKAQLQKDGGLTWKFSFENNRWTPIESHVSAFFKCSPYEAHMTHWPEGQKLLFFDDSGSKYAEFDLKTQKWVEQKPAGKCPMSLYNARSAWDAKRALWIFRLGPNVATFNPGTREFKALPECWQLPPKPTKDEEKAGAKADPRYGWKGICYLDKHDAYLVTGPTGNDTRVYHAADGKWREVKGGDTELVNGYCQYLPDLDLVAMNYQLQCFTLRYVPDER